MLASIRSAKTQLPDFQRGWVWDDDHIKSLLASVSRSFPVGAVMMLQTGNTNVRFKPRAVEGAPPTNGTEPERLILDGQQRLTSLYQALFAGQPAVTKESRGNPIKRWYYIQHAEADSWLRTGQAIGLTGRSVDSRSGATRWFKMGRWYSTRRARLSRS
jgi:hypothetical protein